MLDQARGPWLLHSKKMFGEHMVYANDKPILLICDNQVFVKMLPELTELMSDAETGFPYEGARAHYILNIDNGDLAREVVAVLESITSLPKARKPKLPKTKAGGGRQAGRDGSP